jgi:hypothetical protein
MELVNHILRSLKRILLLLLLRNCLLLRKCLLLFRKCLIISSANYMYSEL